MIEKINEKKIELIFNMEKLKFSEIIIFFKPYKDTAPNVIYTKSNGVIFPPLSFSFFELVHLVALLYLRLSMFDNQER